MGIQINGNTDIISATDGSLTVSGADLGNASASNLNISGIVTATEFSGNVTGNVTGNLTGTASTATAAATAYGLSGSPTLSGITSVSTTNLTVNGNAYPSDGPISGARNRIINGSMSIDQRNAGGSVSVTDGTYTVDRFKYVGSSSRITAQRTSSSPPTGFDYSLLLTSVGANTPGAGEANGIWQIIEANNIVDFAYGTSSAKTSILSFWVKSSSAATYGGAIQNASLNRSYPFSYTINSANTWEYKTIIITGDTTGSWNTTGTSGGITVVFSTGAAAAYKGTANTWASADYRDATGTTNLQATNGVTLNITGVQLEAGTVATPFERRSYGQELALCQRYFRRWPNDSPVGGNGASAYPMWAYGANAASTRICFYPHMRTYPSVALVGSSGGTNPSSGQWGTYANSGWRSSTLYISESTAESVRVDALSGTWNSGDAVGLYFYDAPSSRCGFTATAEL